MRKFILAVAISFVTMAGALLAPGQASAATGDSGPVTPKATAPQCVTFHVPWHNAYIDVTNHCKTTQRVRIIIQLAVDSRCFVLSPGETHRHWATTTARVERLDRC
jgi:hypothetical protein